MNNLHEEQRQVTASLDKELMALQPNPRKLKRQRFAKLYPTIVERLKAGVTQKAILDLLAKHDLKMHPAKFKKLLDEEKSKADELHGSVMKGVAQ